MRQRQDDGVVLLVATPHVMTEVYVVAPAVGAVLVGLVLLVVGRPAGGDELAEKALAAERRKPAGTHQWQLASEF